VPSEFVGAIIGKKGQTIRNITTDSNVSRYGSVYSLLLEVLVILHYAHVLLVQLLLFSDCMLSSIFVSLIFVKSSITNETEWPVTLVMWNLSIHT